MLEETGIRLGAAVSVPTVSGDGWLEVALATLVLTIAESIRLYTKRRFKSEDIDDDLADRIAERLRSSGDEGEESD
uniref:Uncharacterized protein n=1 Tax=viral metagenome TaxID=1070528 RepID=A0A2V0RA93_9ZZZZ